MIWNIEDWNAPRSHQATTTWEAKVQDLTWTFNDNQPRFRHEQWREVFEEQSKSTPLSLIKAGDQLFSLPLGEHLEPFETWLPKEKIWERYSTISHIAVLQGEEREVRSTLRSSSLKSTQRAQDIRTFVTRFGLIIRAFLAYPPLIHACAERLRSGDK